MPWIRNKNNGQTVYVPDSASTGVQIKPPDPTSPYKAPTAAADLRFKTGEIANQDVRTGETRTLQQRTAQQVMDRPNDRSDKMRDDFNRLPEVQSYKTVLPVFMAGLKTAPNATGDNALIYSYAKIMDPGSVVREGEMNMASGGASLIDQTIATLKKQFNIDGGGQLPPNVRTRMKGEMNTKVAQLGKAYDLQRAAYSAMARDQGVNPGHVVGQHEASPYVDDYNRIKQQMQAANRPAAAPAALANAPRKPSGGNGVGAALYRGAGDVAQGAGDVLGIIGNPLNMLVNKVAGTNLSTDLGQTFRDATGAPANITPGQKLANAINRGGIGALIPAGVAGQAGRVLSGVPGAVARMAGTAPGLQTAAGAASGGSGELARQMGAPPLGQAAASLAGGAAVGAGIGALTRPKLGAGIPTVKDLKTKASDLYRDAEARGVTASPEMTAQLRDDVRATMVQEGHVGPTGRISDVHPKIKEAIQLVDDYAGSPMNPTQMQTVRKAITAGLNSKEADERRSAGLMAQVFDEWANPQAPELAQARDISSRYLNAQTLEKARRTANANNSQFTQSGLENALRTQYRGLDKKAIQGNSRYGADLTQAIENVNRGTPLTNAARAAGRFYPSGPVSFGVGTGIPTLAATAVGGPLVGGAVGAGMLGVGGAGRLAATKLGLQNADTAELIARNGGALPDRPMMTPEQEQALLAAMTFQAPQSSLFGSSRKKKSRN